VAHEGARRARVVSCRRAIPTRARTQQQPAAARAAFAAVARPSAGLPACLHACLALRLLARPGTVPGDQIR